MKLLRECKGKEWLENLQELILDGCANGKRDMGFKARWKNKGKPLNSQSLYIYSQTSVFLAYVLESLI
jgi:hypothetical protein